MLFPVKSYSNNIYYIPIYDQGSVHDFSVSDKVMRT